ncbi:MAG: DUF2085 domain-containing protein [Candidatus Micrarchaeota archaeon]
MRSGWLPYAIYTSILLLFTASLFLVPYLLSNPDTRDAGVALFRIYRPMCHQMPSRSFFLFGEQMPICSRDMGMYLGMFLGALAFPFVFRIESKSVPPFVFLFVAMVPIGLDGGIQYVSHIVELPFIGLYESTNALRLATGLLIGIAMSFYAIPLLNGVGVGIMKDMKKS